MRKIADFKRIVTVVMCGALVWLAAPASAATKSVGPNQHYIGIVNTKHTGAVVEVVCPGPATLGRTGPPVGNQTVAVARVRSGGGYTGSFAHEIWARFNQDPRVVVGLTSYNAAKPIPTTLQLPCQGQGTVTFATCLGSCVAVNARSDVVTVTFLNVAV